MEAEKEGVLQHRPTVGMTVLYFDFTDYPRQDSKIHQNSAPCVPAMVTAVWSDTCINLRVIPDGTGTFWRTSQTYWKDMAKPQNNPCGAGWLHTYEYDEFLAWFRKMEESIRKAVQSGD